MYRTILPLVSVLLAFTVSGCDEDHDKSGADERGPLGKADALSGSCIADEGSMCGGPSDGDCFCDVDCVAWGDCCHDAPQCACEGVSCTPGFDGTPLHCEPAPDDPAGIACVPDEPTDPCEGVTCTPGFDGTPLHCEPAPNDPAGFTCVADAPCEGVTCTPGFDGTPMHCEPDPTDPAGFTCVADES
jgi:hypothetical protein